MANRYWVNDAANNDWNTANNWSTTNGGAGGAGVPTSSDDVFFTNLVGASCNLSANSVCLSLNTTTGASNFNGLINVSTYNLTVTNAVTLDGQSANTMRITIGTSSSTGLTCGSISVGQYCELDFATASKINVGGSLTIFNGDTFVTENTGALVLTGNGTYTNIDRDNRFNSITINSGVTVTCANNSRFGDTNGANAITTFTCNGTLAVGTNTITIGVSSAWTMGANSDITGSGTINIESDSGATYTNNRVTAFSFTGTLNVAPASVTDRGIPSWDFSNANFTQTGRSSSNPTYYFSSGTFRCKDFTITSDAVANIFTNTTNNPSFNFSGNVNFSGGTVANLTWTKGTGTITLSGTTGTQTIDFDNESIEDLIISHTGGIKSIVQSFTTDSFSGTGAGGGSVQSSLAGTQRTITHTGNNNALNFSFKDINVSPSSGNAYRINAKGGTNNGNNSGIIFKDIVRG